MLDPIYALALVLAFPAGVGLASLLAALLGPETGPQYPAESLASSLVARGGREYALGAFDRLIDTIASGKFDAREFIATIRARV